MAIDWVKEYHAKHELMIERGYPETDPFSFYRELFPAGSLQKENGDGSVKGNVIVTQVRGETDKRSPQWVVGDSLEGIEKAVGDPFGLIAPVSYFGKTHSKRNAHELFAVTVDLDYVTVGNLKNLLKQFRNGIQLTPSYLVSSGRGLHLYYFLVTPLPMYHESERIYSELKKALIRRLWNDTSSQNGDDPDITGVTQGFRAVGSLSKLGEGFPVRAYKVSERRYTLQEIKDSIPACKVDLSALAVDRMPLEIARHLYPEWYQRRIVEKRPKQKRGTFTQDRRLYEWWKRKMMQEVRSGGRYYSIMALCAFGLKCGVPDREIRKDARAFLDIFESRTEDEDNHFTMQDIDDALKALRKDNRDLTRQATRQWIEENTKVNITPQVRRNGRKQAEHLEEARAIRDIRQARQGKTWNGRKSQKEKVRAWREDHPEGRQVDCVRETGLSRSTVYRHWNIPETVEESAGHSFKSYQDILDYMESLTKDELRQFYETNKEAIDEFLKEMG